MTTSARAALAGALLCALAGCGGGGPTPVPVAGKVTLNGKPLTVARLQFVPDRAKGNTAGAEARGRVDATGAFALETAGQPGAIPGWYKVAVFAFEEVPEGGGPKPPVWLAPMRYADPEGSGLRVEVTADPKPDQYHIQLKP